MSVFIWGPSEAYKICLLKGHICDLAQETKHFWWISVFEGQLRLSLDIEIKWQWCLSSSKDHYAISQIVIQSLWSGRCRVAPVMILHRSWYTGNEFLSSRINLRLSLNIEDIYPYDNNVFHHLKIITKWVKLLCEAYEFGLLQSLPSGDDLAQEPINWWWISIFYLRLTEHWGYFRGNDVCRHLNIITTLQSDCYAKLIMIILMICCRVCPPQFWTVTSWPASPCNTEESASPPTWFNLLLPVQSVMATTTPSTCVGPVMSGNILVRKGL